MPLRSRFRRRFRRRSYARSSRRRYARPSRGLKATRLLVVKRRMNPIYLTSASTAGQWNVLQHGTPTPNGSVPVGSVGGVVAMLGATAVAHPLYGSAVSTCAGYATFSLGNVINFGELTALADQYRIMKVVWTVKYSAMSDGGAGLAANNVGFNPSIYWVQDHDDNAISSVSQVLEFSNVRSRQLVPGKPVKIVMNPRPLAAVVTGAAPSVSNVYTSQRSWLNTSFTDVAHYCLKFVIQDMPLPAAASAQSCITIEPVFHIALKNFN